MFEKKGEKITFPYDSMFLDKKLIFFASMRKVTSSSSASHMFTQPITLRFDGEILQILGNKNNFYDPIQGYEARSGVAESQRNKTDGNKTEDVKEALDPEFDTEVAGGTAEFFFSTRSTDVFDLCIR